ncbi:hypothetical protein NDI44_25810 [Trichocoleus sp. DQ-A3]|uniref:hypothetical protein n=1 Tax=Cyanophyceae TaxID=3028117 RepID=UPI0016855432|nr:hypothetical protein [Coleofasciculus sp. FACHB-125]MBD1898548.1 hypothetical protein [Coleofasciculus sp. FACHB-125]
MNLQSAVFLATEGSGDYDLPGGQGNFNEWEQNFDEPWFAKADVKFVDGQASIPCKFLTIMSLMEMTP